MSPAILRKLLKVPVEIEYCPPGRTHPEILNKAMLPMIWDLFCNDTIALVILRRGETLVGQGPTVPVNPHQPATQSNVKRVDKKIFNFTAKWLAVQHIASVSSNCGFHIDHAARKLVAEDPDPFYPEPNEVAYAALWNRGIWVKLENMLVALDLREAAMPPPEFPKTVPVPAPAPAPAPTPVLSPAAPPIGPETDAAEEIDATLNPFARPPAAPAAPEI